ncbi:MAG: LamG-like jellyroll fold domain-containing protein, partial [Lentisphaeria bacterium]
MKQRIITILLGMFVFSGLFAEDETLRINFDRAQDLQIAGTTLPLTGEFTADHYWVYGQQGLSLPAETLLSEEAGTVFFRFRLQQPETDLLIPRYLLTLRTHSRLSIGWTINGNQSPKWSFAFSDRSKTMRYQSPEALKYNQEYAFAFTYDNNTVCVYLDGKLLSEAPQPLPMQRIGNLNIGPYKDRWLAPKSWGNDCQTKELRVWNRALSPAELARLCGVEFTALHQSQPPLLTVPRLVGTAPVVDGELQEDAWHFAAGMPSLIYGQFKEKTGEIPPHGFMLTYDNQNLYLAFRTLFPGGASIQAGGLRAADFEGEVWGTESFEFYLTISGRCYRFGGNVAGGYVEWLGVDSNWNGEWTYK